MAENSIEYPGFGGRVGRTREESTPWWAPIRRAAPGSPNVVVIFMDDLGYSDIGCYGSEIATPNIDAIAARGQRFNHYTTHAICSPARAALLTGRNAHSVATGWLANNNPGYPGYSGELPQAAATLPEHFKAAGYATIGIGKWHNSPNGVTPNETWPTSRGFDRFYGFLEGETSYFFPARIMNNNMLAPIDSYPPDYYATDDWTDHGIQLVREVRNERPQQPFLLYMAYNAVHGPLQAKEPDLARYRGRYDCGWDVIRAELLARQKALGLVPADARLSPRDPSVPAWDSLPADQRELYVRHMEAYAAMLDCVDQNVGRLVDMLREMGELENTIIVFSADNGGTSSAGPTGAVYFNRRFAGLPFLPVEADLPRKDWIGTGRATALYPMGWGQVSNTPFPSYKTYTGGGGRRVNCIVSWPKALAARGEIREQFAHVTDVLPTLLDLAGVPALTESHGQPALPIHGKSLAPVLNLATQAPTRNEQYYECWANRAYYRDGWVAVSLQKRGSPVDFGNWTLHRHSTDFSESEDLAAQHPDILADLIQSFDKAAWENLVYPLDNRLPIQKFNEMPPHLRPPAQSSRRFMPGGQTIHRGTVSPLISDRNFRIRVRLNQGAGDEGVLFSIGDVAGGVVLYIESGQLQLFYNGYGIFHRPAPVPMPSGTCSAVFEFEALGKRTGRGRLLVEAAQAGGKSDAAGASALSAAVAGPWSELSPTLMAGYHEGLDIGLDRRAPVDWALFERKGAFRYSGLIHELLIESGPFAPDSPFGKA